MFNRNLKISENSSFFLFGPRGTGKTTLLKKLFEKRAVFIDLLDPGEEDLFNRDPNELEHRLAGFSRKPEWVVIDEIQKAPRLLDVVHSLIESGKGKFAMTGSSPRKLRRGASNLLAGRAFVYHLFPLSASELGDKFDMSEILEWGTLPKIFQFQEKEEKKEFLSAYALTYLKEEITVEQLVRKVTPFRNFLEVAAQSNGQIINYSKIGYDIGVDTKTVQSYFDILEDTVIGFRLNPYHRSIRKRQRVNPKFFFFDTGVKRALDRTLSQALIPGTYAFGNAFEHLVILELLKFKEYRRLDWNFSYLRTKDDAEIDLIIERPGMPPALIEIKSSAKIGERDIGVFKNLVRDFGECRAFLLSLDPKRKSIDSALCIHWRDIFDEILQ